MNKEKEARILNQDPRHQLQTGVGKVEGHAVPWLPPAGASSANQQRRGRSLRAHLAGAASAWFSGVGAAAV